MTIQQIGRADRGGIVVNGNNSTIYLYLDRFQKIVTAKTADPSICPYRGLEAFHTEHASLFAGREKEIESLTSAIVRRPATGLVAASGAGKSSLVYAGLIPALAARDAERWDIFAFRPGRDPITALFQALSRKIYSDKIPASQFINTTSLVNDFRQDKFSLQTFINNFCHYSDNTDGNRQVLLIVDQFEEFYTQAKSFDRELILKQALDSVQDGNIKLLLTMRADFVGEMMQNDPEIFSLIEDKLCFLTPMNEANIRSAVKNPAQVVKLSVPEDLVKLLIDATRGQPGFLPYLQFVLRQLWLSRDPEVSSLTVDAYYSMGGLKGAIGRHASTVYDGLNSGDKALARAILPRLVGPSNRGVDVSLRLPLKDFDSEGQNLLRRLAAPDARLIVLSSRSEVTSDRETVAEFAHEALIREWDDLQGWIAERGALFALSRKLSLISTDWTENSRDNSYLILKGKALTDAQHLICNSTKGEISDDVRDFVLSNTKILNQKKRKSAFVLIFIIILLFFGFLYQRDQYKSTLILNKSAREREGLLIAPMAEKLSVEGKTDSSILASLHLLSMFEGEDIPPQVLPPLDKILNRATKQRVIEIPAHAVSVWIRGVPYYQEDDGWVMRVSADGQAQRVCELGAKLADGDLDQLTQELVFIGVDRESLWTCWMSLYSHSQRSDQAPLDTRDGESVSAMLRAPTIAEVQWQEPDTYFGAPSLPRFRYINLKDGRAFDSLQVTDPAIVTFQSGAVGAVLSDPARSKRGLEQLKAIGVPTVGLNSPEEEFAALQSLCSYLDRARSRPKQPMDSNENSQIIYRLLNIFQVNTLIERFEFDPESISIYLSCSIKENFVIFSVIAGGNGESNTGDIYGYHFDGKLLIPYNEWIMYDRQGKPQFLPTETGIYMAQLVGQSEISINENKIRFPGRILNFSFLDQPRVVLELDSVEGLGIDSRKALVFYEISLEEEGSEYPFNSELFHKNSTDNDKYLSNVEPDSSQLMLDTCGYNYEYYFDNSKKIIAVQDELGDYNVSITGIDVENTTRRFPKEFIPENIDSKPCFEISRSGDWMLVTIGDGSIYLWHYEDPGASPVFVWNDRTAKFVGDGPDVVTIFGSEVELWNYDHKNNKFFYSKTAYVSSLYLEDINVTSDSKLIMVTECEYKDSCQLSLIDLGTGGRIIIGGIGSVQPRGIIRNKEFLINGNVALLKSKQDIIDILQNKLSERCKYTENNPEYSKCYPR